MQSIVGVNAMKKIGKVREWWIFGMNFELLRLMVMSLLNVVGCL
jgi:hypothetical protein